MDDEPDQQEPAEEQLGPVAEGDGPADVPPESEEEELRAMAGDDLAEEDRASGGTTA